MALIDIVISSRRSNLCLELEYGESISNFKKQNVNLKENKTKIKSKVMPWLP